MFSLRQLRRAGTRVTRVMSPRSSTAPVACERLVRRRLARPAPQPPPPGPLRLRIRRGDGGHGSPAAPPTVQFDVDVPRLGDHGRPALELPPGIDDPGIEVLHDLADLLFAELGIEPRVELGVLGAEQDRLRAQAGDVLPLDQALDPPVGVVRLAQPGNGFAGVLEVVELALRHGIPDQVLGLGGVVDLGALLPEFLLGGVELVVLLRGAARGPHGPEFRGTLHPAPERAVGTTDSAAHQSPPSLPVGIADLPSSMRNSRAAAKGPCGGDTRPLQPASSPRRDPYTPVTRC